MTVSKATISLLILLLAHHGSWAADSVDISACAIEGVKLGDTSNHVRETFGKPTGRNPSCIDCTDQPYTWISYDGLRVDFVQWETIHIEVVSDAYRLPTGLGVGSTRAEVIAEYGDPLVTELVTGEFLTYAITWGDGRKTAHTLDFKIHDGLVIGFKVGPKRTGSPYP